MTESCRTYNLTEVVERFCAMQFNDHRRGFKNMLVIAAQVWDEIFRGTLWVENSGWLEVQRGNPYPLIELPAGGSDFRLFREVGHCNGGYRLVPMKPSTIMATGLPVEKTCGCAANCGCSWACGEANSFSYTENVHTIDGADYVERLWYEMTATGDIMEWREMPTKVYRDYGTHGTMTRQFSDEFSVEMENYDVGTVKLNRRLAALELKPCGCVAETESNQQVLVTYCGCVYGADQFWGTAAAPTYRISRDRKHIEIMGGTQTHYFMRWRQAGASEQSPIPAYSLKTIWDGINYYVNAYQPATVVHPNIRQGLLRQYNRSKLQMVMYLNPINWDRLQQRHDEPQLIETAMKPKKPGKKKPVLPTPTPVPTPLPDSYSAGAIVSPTLILPFKI